MFGGQIKFTPGADKKPAPDAALDHGADEGAQGDGFHHHDLHQHESGFHSKHTHPDGHSEDADHADYEEAKAHMDGQMAPEDMGADDGGEEAMGRGEDADDMPDFSAAYSKGK